MRRQKVVGKGKVTVRRARASRTDGMLRGYKVWSIRGIVWYLAGIAEDA